MVNSSLIQFRALLARQQLLQQQHHTRLARRIHDEVSQKLTLLTLHLSLAMLDPIPPANWTQKCEEWSSMVLQLGNVMHDISGELRPCIMDDLGLVAALRRFADSRPNGIACQLITPDAPMALPLFAANEVFALCREIVTDCFAPNGVTEMSTELDQTAELLRIQLRVQTVKPGSDPLTAQALDALSVHERLACVDGTAVADQQPGRGFAVTLSVRTAPRTVSAAA